MLESGTKVKVKSKEEINKTLDSDNTCNGVVFNHTMYAFCGQTLTLTAYFDNGAYSVKESFYNWRPEWFDVIEEPDMDIWSDNPKDVFLNLAMLHQVRSGNPLDLFLLVEDLTTPAFSNRSSGGFNYADYPAEKWESGTHECDNPPNYKWLKLKPEIVEKIIRAACKQKRLFKLIEFHDDPCYWFTWSDTVEGSNYWGKFQQAYTSDSQTLTNTTQNERNQIKLQRKKTAIRVGTVPEGHRVHGKRCKTSIRIRHLSHSARVGY